MVNGLEGEAAQRNEAIDTEFLYGRATRWREGNGICKWWTRRRAATQGMEHNVLGKPWLRDKLRASHYLHGTIIRVWRLETAMEGSPSRAITQTAGGIISHTSAKVHRQTI